MKEIRPHDGPQCSFLASPADIAIFGGSAGSGKSMALLLEPLRHINNPQFGGVIFRRTSPQLTGAGSLWEKAQELYRPLGAKMRESPTLSATFPSGATLEFLHLQHVKDIYAHQGKAYAFSGWDELTHFSGQQFWYLVSRMRSTSGIRPCMRATTNPDPDSFVRELIAWWLDDKSGTPVPERAGVLRWFVRIGDTLMWGDTEAELRARYPGQEPLSLTFIAAKLEDNPALTTADPGYRSRLMALPEVERERLLGGNWNIRPNAGKYIRPEWFGERYDKLPQLTVYMASDYAVTEPEDGSDPDWTEHGVFGLAATGDIYVIDWWSGQTESDQWVEKLLDLAAVHRPAVYFGEGGVIQKAIEPYIKRRMNERKIYLNCEWLPSIVDKATRGRTFQAMAKLGKVRFGRQDFSRRVVDQCVAFPGAKHDDAFDVMSLFCRALEEHVHTDVMTSSKPKADSYRVIDAPRPQTWRGV